MPARPAGTLAIATAERKNAALVAMADAIAAARDDILAANAIDMAERRGGGHVVASFSTG